MGGCPGRERFLNQMYWITVDTRQGSIACGVLGTVTTIPSEENLYQPRIFLADVGPFYEEISPFLTF